MGGYTLKYNLDKLQNGLTILTVPSKDAESVVVDFFVKAGSRYEQPHEGGMSHFLEHFLFKGTKKFPTALAISELVDAIGGEMNANTGKEHTQYYIKASSKYLPLIFEILTDMLQAPLFDPIELEKEKGVIVEELNMYKDIPMYEIENVLERHMWPGDPLGRDIIGTKESVTSFTPEMFKSYMDRCYQMPNMILGVAGKFDPKVLNKLIKQYWVNVPKKKHISWLPVKDDQSKFRTAVQFKETEQGHVAIAFKGLPHVHAKHSTLQVLSAVLGGGMSSRLFTEVREKRGLAYSVRCHSSSYRDTGGFQVEAGVKVDKLEEAVKVIMSELEKVSNELIGDKEINKAKEYLKGKTTLALEDNQVRLDWYLDQVAFKKKIETPVDAYALIDKVTAKQVRDLAKQIITKDKLTIAAIGPYKDSKMIEKLL